MLKIQFAKKIDTEVKTIQKGLELDTEKKKKHDYSTEELYLERELSYKENQNDILRKIM